jgi:hypothetical protein
MLKKTKIRLLTRAAHCRESVFAGAYRAATVREPVPNDFFSSLLENDADLERALSQSTGSFSQIYARGQPAPDRGASGQLHAGHDIHTAVFSICAG